MTDYQPAPGDAMPPQPVPQPAPQPQELQKHHVHHSYIWLGSLRIAFMLLVVVFFSSFSAIMGAISDGEVITRNDFPTLLIVIACVIGGLVLIIGLTAIYQVISYKHLYYELGPEEFNLYSGILNKKRVHVPYQRIQSVDQRASLIQRIFGVCNVSIDTAGGASNKAVMVPYVQKTQAEELRRELFARKQYVAAVQRGVAPDAAAAAVAVAAGVPVPHNGNNVLDARPKFGRMCAACSAVRPSTRDASRTSTACPTKSSSSPACRTTRRSSWWSSALSAPLRSS